MSNYFWTANGNYLKKNIIEKLSKGFIADDKGFCIDETCLTKEDMILIKEQVSYFSFFNSTINNKDILTNLEVKRYFTEVFKKIADANKPDANKPILEYISDYLVYGLNDEITNEIINLKDLNTISIPSISPAQEEVKYIPCVVNGVFDYFVFDTGCYAGLAINNNLFEKILRTGNVLYEDYIGDTIITTAVGSYEVVKVVIMDEVIIGLPNNSIWHLLSTQTPATL